MTRSPGPYPGAAAPDHRHYVKAWRGDYELVTFNCPCTYTDDTVSRELLPAIAEIVGEENISNTGPMAGTEDFSYVAEAVPSMFICLVPAVPTSIPTTIPAWCWTRASSSREPPSTPTAPWSG